MNDRQTKVLKLLFLAAAAFFAPIWIPVAVIVIAPTLLFLAGVTSIIAISITSVLTVIFGIVGIPILFSMALTAGCYLMYKVFEKITAKAFCILVQFYSELKVKGLVKFELKQFVKGLPIINRFVARQDNDHCLCQQPLYEEESESETVVSHVRRPSMHLPFPKASLPSVDASEDGDEIEVFFNNLEELNAVISKLRRSARNRAASRRMLSRRNTTE